MKRLWAVVPAAGAGLRLGGDIPKQYREVAGAPLMEHTLRALLQSRDICGVVVAMDPADPRADTIASLSDERVQTTPGESPGHTLFWRASMPLKIRWARVTGRWFTMQLDRAS